jgi:hypothetical protein
MFVPAKDVPMLARSVRVILVLLAAIATAQAEDKLPTPGNPPRVLVARSIDAKGRLQLVTYRTIYIGFDGSSYNDRTVHSVPLDGVKIVTVGGDEIAIDAARKLLADKETPILGTSWGSPLPGFYRGVFAKGTLLFVFPKDAPAWPEIQDPTRPVER